jgi:hypothetical protein
LARSQIQYAAGPTALSHEVHVVLNEAGLDQYELVKVRPGTHSSMVRRQNLAEFREREHFQPKIRVPGIRERDWFDHHGAGCLLLGMSHFDH